MGKQELIMCDWNIEHTRHEAREKREAQNHVKNEVLDVRDHI